MAKEVQRLNSHQHRLSNESSKRNCTSSIDLEGNHEDEKGTNPGIHSFSLTIFFGYILRISVGFLNSAPTIQAV